MSLQPFNGANPSNVLAALYRDRTQEEVISLQFRSPVWPRRSNSLDWPRLQAILAVPAVYEAFGISALPRQLDAASAEGLEVIGTLANRLNRLGIHAYFVHDLDTAIVEARRYLDVFFLRNYANAEAYSYSGAWCDWFWGDAGLDETVVIGNGHEWWLLAFTGTD